jgi:hypothetical protein
MTMLQNLIVGLIVIWALWVAASRLLPRPLRAALRKYAARLASAVGLARLAQRLATPASAAGSCGGCDSCGDKPAAAPAKDGVVGGIGVEALRRTIRR